jgi:hypothetical protein
MNADVDMRDGRNGSHPHIGFGLGALIDPGARAECTIRSLLFPLVTIHHHAYAT